MAREMSVRYLFLPRMFFVSDVVMSWALFISFYRLFPFLQTPFNFQTEFIFVYCSKEPFVII